ncbi:MAG: hypothetical protein JXP34_10345 [Planctomycetes bacterium]|nr:hypothetical protein [Planctomycetota bacterium]
MDLDAVAGWIVVACALGAIAYLTLWSRRAIDRIAARGPRTARAILKEVDGDGADDRA